MKKVAILVVLGFILQSFIANAQELTPKKEGLAGIRSGKRTRWIPNGQNLEFFLKDDPARYRASVHSTVDSMIYLTFSDGITSPIAYSEFDKIRFNDDASSGKQLLRTSSYALPVAGVVFFLMDTFNYALQGEKVKVTSTGLTVGSSLVSAGLIVNFLTKPKTYKIDRNAKLLYVNEPAIQLRPKSL